MNFRAGWVDDVKLVLLLATTRIVMGILLYYSVGIGDLHRAEFIDASVKLPYRWLYLVTSWDSVYYISIAKNWYPATLAPVWAFFPLYPATIRVIDWMGIDPSIAAFTISIVAGFLSVPLFARIAGRYLSQDKATTATLLYFLLPPVFLFSGVSYSESLFLLLSLLTWEYHQKGNDARAALVSALVTLTRIYGVLIAVPLAYSYYRNRQFRKFAYSAISPLTLLGWVVYGYWISGVWFPMLGAQSYFNPTDPTIEKDVIQLASGSLAALKPLLRFWPVVAVSSTFVVFIVILCYRTWITDRALGLYVALSVVIISVFGIFPAVRSFPRYFSFLFPIGLGLYAKMRLVRVTAILLLLVLDFLLWWGLMAGIVT